MNPAIEKAVEWLNPPDELKRGVYGAYISMIVEAHRARLSRKGLSCTPQAAAESCTSISAAADALAAALAAAPLEVEEYLFPRPPNEIPWMPRSIDELGSWKTREGRNIFSTLAFKARGGAGYFQMTQQRMGLGRTSMEEFRRSVDHSLVHLCAILLEETGIGLDRLRAFAALVKVAAVGEPVPSRWGEKLAQRVKSEMANLH